MKKMPLKPVVFLIRGCPFCMKVRIFLLESGLLDRVEVKDFAAGSEGARSVGAELAPHFEKVTYPVVKLSADEYSKGSDEIIALFAERWNVLPSSLSVYSDYSAGVFENLVALYHENASLKEKLG